MRTYIVDSFTDQPFKGNPAGVCITTTELADSLMQNIAFELGFSETAFVCPNPDGSYQIRYFSPKVEIPLCGHATLASAKVISTNGHHDHIRFHTIQGITLEVVKQDDLLTMEFPVYDLEPASVEPTMLEALGLTEVLYCGYNAETNILLLEIADTTVLSALAPNFPLLVASSDSVNGVLITAKAHDGSFDFHSRYFWPWSGTNEDPVTGGTHTFLAKFWSERLGKTKMRSFQASSRSGQMIVEITARNTLLISGEATIILDGNLVIPGLAV